ncbi:MAG: hypothetical protein C4339_03045 [Nitrososphaerota archaeon]|mgnify:CR=1 FL=1
MEKLAGEWAWSTEPIILPLAYDAREWGAAYLALYLSECTGAPLHALHVWFPGLKEDEAFLHRVRARAQRLGISLEVKELEGRSPNKRQIARQIVLYASQVGAQAIIMAGHKEGVLTHLLGRVSDTVAKLAECRVLIAESRTMAEEKLASPRRLLVAYTKAPLDPEPLIVAAAMTSSAWSPGLEIWAVRFVKVPPTVPLDSEELRRALRGLEKDFNAWISEATRALGRVIIPHVQPVRELGADIASYARDQGMDMILLPWGRPSRLRALGRPDDVQLVERAPCPVALVFGPKRRGLSQEVRGPALLQPWTLKA